MPTAPLIPTSWLRLPARSSTSLPLREFQEYRMLGSVQLNLLMGPFVPMTVPRPVLDALDAAEVTVNDTGTSGFQLKFIVDKQSPLQILFLLSGGSPLLFMRVVLVAIVNGVSEVLI